MGEKAVDRLLSEMDRRNIHTHLGSKLKAMEADKVVTETETIASDLILFIPGMTGPDWAADSGLGLSEGGFFQANEHCRVSGSDRIYVAGDAGSFPGPEWKPKQAHMADLQAETAAKNIVGRLKGEDDGNTFRTELICIIDSNTTGTMVYRDPKRSLQMKGKPFHWAKSLFEWNYLRPYR
jgi:sulfide:quinone oxidoreductase